LSYSIIIPVYNEINLIRLLLRKIEIFLKKNPVEIVIVDDGSTDGTSNILNNCKFIKLLCLKHNEGKGAALREGLKIANHDKIIIFDGDLEIDPKNITKLMILNESEGINCIFGSRYNQINPLSSLWSLGNYAVTKFFNLIHDTSLTDSLCCAKAFYKKHIKIADLNSKGFDIDLELSKMLISNVETIDSVYLDYNRRSRKEGKKLNFRDGWVILKRALKK